MVDLRDKALESVRHPATGRAQRFALGDRRLVTVSSHRFGVAELRRQLEQIGHRTSNVGDKWFAKFTTGQQLGNFVFILTTKLTKVGYCLGCRIMLRRQQGIAWTGHRKALAADGGGKRHAVSGGGHNPDNFINHPAR